MKISKHDMLSVLRRLQNEVHDFTLSLVHGSTEVHADQPRPPPAASSETTGHIEMVHSPDLIAVYTDIMRDCPSPWSTQSDIVYTSKGDCRSLHEPTNNASVIPNCVPFLDDCQTQSNPFSVDWPQTPVVAAAPSCHASLHEPSLSPLYLCSDIRQDEPDPRAAPRSPLQPSITEDPVLPGLFVHEICNIRAVQDLESMFETVSGSCQDLVCFQ